MRSLIIIPIVLGLLVGCKKDENTGSNCVETNLVAPKGNKQIPEQLFLYLPEGTEGDVKQALAQFSLANRWVREYTLVDAHLVNGAASEFTVLRNVLPSLNIEPVQAFSIAQNCATESFDIGNQDVPWGISRVGARTATDKRAWIVDTGIDLDHPDLNVNTDLSRDFVGSSGIIGGIPIGVFADDGNGHGTHVAGTVGAINNDFGVVGVAAGCDLVAIRVLDDNGRGNSADVMNGLDYISQNGNAGEAVNLSLGGGTSTLLDQSVRNLGSQGFFVSMAAGNSSENASNTSPARANGENLFTVSAFNQGDRFASYSNFGNPPVDFTQPGTNILSTLPDGRYGITSGTSMAAPHLAGLLLLNGTDLATDGTVTGDPDGDPDRIAVLR